MLAGHRGSPRLPRRGRPPLVAIVSCLRPQYHSRFRPCRHRTPSCQTPVRDSLNRGRLPSIYRRPEPIPCRKTSRFEPRCFGLCRKYRFQNPANGAHRFPQESNRDVRAPLRRFENHLYVRGTADTSFPAHCQGQLRCYSFPSARDSAMKSVLFPARRERSAGKLPLHLR